MASSAYAARRPLSPVLIVGSVAGAATTGAILAMGRRLGAAGFPFAAIAAGLLHETARSTWTLFILGALIHLAVTFVWSAVAVWCYRALGWRPPAIAFAVAIAAHTLSWILAWSTGNGIASVLAFGDRLVLAVVFGFAVVVGIRIAFSAPRSA